MSKLKKVLLISGVIGAIGTPVALYLANGGADIEEIKELILAGVVGLFVGSSGTGITYYALTTGFRKVMSSFNNATTEISTNDKNAKTLINKVEMSNEEIKDYVRLEITKLVENEIKPLVEKVNTTLETSNLIQDKLNNGIVKTISLLTEPPEEEV